MRTWIVFICLLLTASAGAQYQEEDQTQDHQDLDSRYYERHSRSPERNASFEAFLERADDLIRDRNYRAASSERYRVQSDDPRLDAEAAVGLLDEFRAHFERFWSGRSRLAVYDNQSRIFLFYSFRKLNQVLTGDFRFNSIRPKGHYGSLFDVITMHSDSCRPEELGNSLVHEAAHQLIDRRLFGFENIRPAPWIAEGLASYFGYTFQNVSGNFEAGVVGGKHARLMKDVRSRGSNEIKQTIRAGKQAFKESKREGESLVGALVTADDPSSFYGPRARFNYAASWILVHFLLHGEESTHADRFIAYLELVSQGDAGPESLFEQLGMNPEELDTALEKHLNGLKVH